MRTDEPEKGQDSMKETSEVVERVQPTSGPWVIGPKDATGAVSIIAEGSRAIIEIRNPWGHDRHAEEIMATAQLVAAAPELLAACEAALAMVDEEIDDLSDPTLVAMRAAVARARGRA